MIQKTFFVSALLLSAYTAVAEQDVINKSFNAKAGGTLSMNVDRGSIKVLTANTDKVEIEVVRELNRASAEEAREAFEKHQIEFTQDGETVRIESESGGLNPFKGLLNRLGVKYTITVPAKFNVDLRTAGGNVAVADLEGQAKVQTTGGSLDLGRISDEIQARTSGGNIKIQGGRKNVAAQTTGGSVMIGKVEGDLKVKSSGGNITVDTIKGEIEANTTGGSIKIGSAGGPVKATSSGGNVSAELADGAPGQCTLKTTGGSVKLMVPEKIAADLNASTVGGRVNSDFDGEFNKQRTKLVAKLNGGGPEMRLSTAGGNVEIRKK
jgi:DUF4097 and DUF4098 domain-containing protein YvlB